MANEVEMQKMKDWIDSASYEQLLRRWRNAPIGSPWCHGEVGDYFEEVLYRKREEDPAAHVAASKSIGWEGGDY